MRAYVIVTSFIEDRYITQVQFAGCEHANAAAVAHRIAKELAETDPRDILTSGRPTGGIFNLFNNTNGVLSTQPSYRVAAEQINININLTGDFSQ